MKGQSTKEPCVSYVQGQNRARTGIPLFLPRYALIANICHHAWLSMWVLDVKPKFLYLQDKPFTN